MGWSRSGTMAGARRCCCRLLLKSRRFAVATVSRSGLTHCTYRGIGSAGPTVGVLTNQVGHAAQVSIDRADELVETLLRGHDTRMPGGDSRRGQPAR